MAQTSALKTIHILLKNSSRSQHYLKYLTQINPFPQQVKFEIAESLHENIEACLIDPSCFADLQNQKISLPTSLKWCHSTWAGADGFLKFLPEKIDFKLTRSAIYGRMIAEYCIAHIINVERQNFLHHDNQKNSTWSDAFHGNLAVKYSSLKHRKMAVLGSGEIGAEISRLFKYGFDIQTVAALVRNNRADTSETVSNFYTEIDDLLEHHGADLDILVSVLPSTPKTQGLLTPERLSQLKNCVFVNVGRGDLLSEATILWALQENHFKNAILDVLPIEPLPKDSPLWQHPKVVITPHVSGKDNEQDIV